MNRDDLEDARIRAALQRDLGRLEAGLVDDPAAAVGTRVRARSRRRRAVVATTTVIGLFAVAATTATVIDDEPAKVETVSPTEEQQPTTPAPPDLTPGDRSSGQNPLLPLTAGIMYLEEPPLRPRWGPAMVWTGSEIVAWGGQASDGSERTFTDGAAYNVATRRWRPMAQAPLPGGESRPVGVMTGAGVVIAQGANAARWEPATNTWSELPDPPRPVVDLATDGTLAVSASANAVLDTRDGRWRELPEPPVHLERPTTAWTGSQLIVVGGPSTAFASAVALAVDPSEGMWRRLATPPDRLHAEALSADWDGERVVVVNYDMQAVAYDPRTDQWEQLPDTPARFFENAPTFASPGDGTGVAFHALAAVVRTAGGAWVPLPNALLPQGRVISP